MKTGLLNRCRLLASNRKRALLIGQTLCLLAIAAFFVISPVAMAICGKNNNNNGQAQKQQAIAKTAKQTTNIKILAIISKVTQQTKIEPGALNAATLKVPAGATVDGYVTLTQYTKQTLLVGNWILIQQTDPTGATISYAATLFGEKVINGSTTLEVWPAETPANLPAGIKPIAVGHKIFVTLTNFTTGIVTGVA